MKLKDVKDLIDVYNNVYVEDKSKELNDDAFLFESYDWDSDYDNYTVLGISAGYDQKDGADIYLLIDTKEFNK